MKDYYHVLGVSEGATQAEIRSAYRRQARAVHPDCSDEDGGSFREVQEAYDVLGDPACRRAYDRKRQRAIRQPQAVVVSTNAGGSPARRSQSDLLDELRQYFGRYGEVPRQAPPAARDLELRVRLSRREACEGGRLQFALSLAEACSQCGGSGAIGYSPCPFCRAKGVVRRQMPVELSFPPGIRDGQQVEFRLAAAGPHELHLRLTFTISG